MKKVYHLATCKTCQKVISEFKLDKDFELQNTKESMITLNEFDELLTLGDYTPHDLFNKRAMKYRKLEPKIEDRSEAEVKSLILSEYTFIKRPIIRLNNSVFVATTKKEKLRLHEALAELRSIEN